MKELSAEEKADRYDEAKSIMEKYLKSGNAGVIAESTIKKAFPELKEKENEDERMIKFITNELACLRATDEKGTVRYNELTEAITWLEKQGEQKPTDKLEPKFKVGEWCIDNEDGTIFQIVKVLDNTYTYKTNEGKEYSCTHYSLENDAKLWTIQDAKEGDVLAVNNEIFIYAHRKQLYSIAVAHCFVDSASGFYLDGEFGYEEHGKTIYPATKEQRDLLFQKMKEASYEWDAEKKKLSNCIIDESKSEIDYCFTKMMNGEKVSPPT